ncbi:TPA: phage portal protein [Klebsiella variicola subsp. variicola]|nr:phage portal protein [Klebsiella variicola subsp. variicola]
MFNIFRRKAKFEEKALSQPTGRGGWFSIVHEPFTGAWQKNIELRRDTILTYHAIFACITLIGADISKMPLELVAKKSNGIWQGIEDPEISPLLRKPNANQNRMQFFETWINSKLTRGNTYVLKIRDNKGRVRELRILDPERVKPLVSDDGAVFYELQAEDFTGLKQAVTVPAREIIHDRFNTFFHPLIGLPPIVACGLAATHGHHIQNTNTAFFQNGGRPGGIIQVPGAVDSGKLREIKDAWEAGYTGTNAGRTAVLSDGMEYKAMTVSASDSQAVEQLKLTAEIVCSVFHVPLYKIGLGTMPAYNNIEALDQQYYSQCLQTLIEAIELCIKEGLDLDDKRDVEFDLNALLRMDTSARYKSHSEAIGGGWLSPNEARRKENMSPVDGGDSPYLQQQNYSLAALNKRDTQQDPFTTNTPAAPTPGNDDPSQATPPDSEEQAKAVTRLLLKSIAGALPRND